MELKKQLMNLTAGYYEDIYIEDLKKDNLAELVDLLTFGNMVAIVDERDGAPDPRGIGLLLADPRMKINRDQLLFNVKGSSVQTTLDVAVLEGLGDEWIHQQYASTIPAVFAGTRGTVHCVNKSDGFLYSLLTAFYKKTKVPLLICSDMTTARISKVETIEDVVEVFKDTSTDVLVIRDIVLTKEHFKCY